MPTEPAYALVNAEDLDTIQEALGYMVDRAETPGAFQRADDLTKRIESGQPLVDVQIHGSGEWAGLYLDGKLVAYGDTYLAEEKLQAIVRAKIVQEGDWLLEDGRTPLGTIEEVEERRMKRLGGEQAVAEKVAEAERLLAEAAEIDGKKRFVGAA